MKNGATYFRPDFRDPEKMVETDKNHCLTPKCHGIVNKKREHSPYCSKCRSRRWKEKFPLHYSFHHLRNRARERGKEFTLTRQQYLDFAVKTNYAKLKGKTSMSLSVDRVDNSRGYSFDNIQAITLSENSRKQFVPYFAKQMETIAYHPSDEELSEVRSRL